eukprot:g12774.t1
MSFHTDLCLSCHGRLLTLAASRIQLLAFHKRRPPVVPKSSLHKERRWTGILPALVKKQNKLCSSYGQAYGQQGYAQAYQQQPGYQQQYQQSQQMTQQQYQQQQMQQQQMQQQQMMQQKQREEEQRRQEQQRRAEQQGIMNCQSILQKLSAATPETFLQIKDEVEKLVMQELPKCGSQAEVVKAEALQQIQVAQMRVEQVKQQRAEEERQNQERSEEVKKVLAELNLLVDKAEQDTAQLKSAAAPVLESKIMSEEDARAAGKVVGEVSVAAKASCKVCSDFIVERRVGIDSVKPPQLAAIREEQLKLQSRIQECYKIVVSSTISARVMIDKAIKKTLATKTLEKRTSAFEKYNGKKEVMTVDEIIAYAKGEFSFALSKEAAAAVVKKYGDGRGSVGKAHFQRIKVAVGILREEEASKARRKEAELKRLALEAKKKAIEADIQKVLDVLTEAEPAVAKAEEAGKVEHLSKDYLGATPDKDAVAKAMEAACSACKDAQTELSEVRTRLADLIGSADDDIKQWTQMETRKVELKVGSMDARLGIATQASERGRAFLELQEAKELHLAKVEVAKLLRSKKLGAEELFKEADKDGDGLVNLSDFTTFMEGCEGCKLSGEQIEKVFNFFEPGSGFSKDTLFLASRSYYLVAAETVITDKEGLEEGQTVRRLELKELVEVLEGPVEEASAKIQRVRCRAIFDGVEGWATITGNNGTEYLTVSDGNMEVLREVPLTEALEESNALRQLPVGQKLEVLEWDKKTPNEDVRLKVKVKGSSDIGWTTRATADGTQFLKIQ